MEVITAKKCSCCDKVLPIDEFRYRADKAKHSAACYTCERGKALRRYHKAERHYQAPWVPDPLNAALNNFRAAEPANGGLFWRVA